MAFSGRFPIHTGQTKNTDAAAAPESSRGQRPQHRATERWTVLGTDLLEKWRRHELSRAVLLDGCMTVVHIRRYAGLKPAGHLRRLWGARVFRSQGCGSDVNRPVLYG